MPSTIKKMSSTSAYEMIASKLSQSAILNFANPYEELVEAKHDRLTYFKAYDASHWNNYGAFIGYESLMEQVQKVIPDIRILTEDDFIITEKVFETMKENGFSTNETDLVYELKSNQVISDKEYLAQLGFHGTDQWKSYNYYRNSDMTLPTAMQSSCSSSCAVWRDRFVGRDLRRRLCRMLCITRTANRPGQRLPVCMASS